jgi:hypothetical protein
MVVSGVRLIGFFAELNPNRSDLSCGSIFEAIQDSKQDDERELIDYLRDGAPLIDIMESVLDAISGDGYVTGGSSILTDGVWIWREDLPYYVEHYHIRLTEEFVRHVRALAYKSADS